MYYGDRSYSVTLKVTEALVSARMHTSKRGLLPYLRQ